MVGGCAKDLPAENDEEITLDVVSKRFEPIYDEGMAFAYYMEERDSCWETIDSCINYYEKLSDFTRKYPQVEELYKYHELLEWVYSYFDYLGLSLIDGRISINYRI